MKNFKKGEATVYFFASKEQKPFCEKGSKHLK